MRGRLSKLVRMQNTKDFLRKYMDLNIPPGYLDIPVKLPFSKDKKASQNRWEQNIRKMRDDNLGLLHEEARLIRELKKKTWFYMTNFNAQPWTLNARKPSLPSKWLQIRHSHRTKPSACTACQETLTATSRYQEPWTRPREYRVT